MAKFDDLRKLRDKAAAAAALAKEHADKVEQIKGIATSAADEAKLVNKKGKVSKWRVAKAAVRPTTTSKRLIKGATDAGKRAGLEAGMSQMGMGTGGTGGEMPGMPGLGGQQAIFQAMQAFQRQAAALLAQRKEELGASGLGFSPELQQEIAEQAAANPHPPGMDPTAPASADDVAAAQEVAAKALRAQYPPDGFAAGDPRIAPACGVSFPTFAIAARAIGWSTDRDFIGRVVAALGLDLATWDAASEEWGRRMQDDVVVAAFYGQLFSQA